jgi:hypothetical protein
MESRGISSLSRTEYFRNTGRDVRRTPCAFRPIAMGFAPLYPSYKEVTGRRLQESGDSRNTAEHAGPHTRERQGPRKLSLGDAQVAEDADTFAGIPLCPEEFVTHVTVLSVHRLAGPFVPLADFRNFPLIIARSP